VGQDIPKLIVEWMLHLSAQAGKNPLFFLSSPNDVGLVQTCGVLPSSTTSKLHFFLPTSPIFFLGGGFKYF